MGSGTQPRAEQSWGQDPTKHTLIHICLLCSASDTGDGTFLVLEDQMGLRCSFFIRLLNIPSHYPSIWLIPKYLS